MLDHDNKFYLESLSILSSCLMENIWIFLGEVKCKSLLEVGKIKRRG